MPNTARVALESTVITHGLPHPHNARLARQMEANVAAHGATPATIGIIAGEPIVGLSPAQLDALATTAGALKVSMRDLPAALARRAHGGTTVSATMWLAHRAGIEVFATGGIGGVHRVVPGAGASHDVSNDLDALGRIPMTIVCAGPKAILDLAATREQLETRGVTVVGYQTDTMPGFYYTDSGLPVDVRCDSVEAIAEIVRARRSLDLPAATLVVVPVPEEAALARKDVEPAIETAVREAEARGIRAADATPYLLAAVAALTEGRSREANLALLLHNAGVAARLAVALAG
ncbi:MAG: pseudouridine-5'-phosphate glycosidase [Rhodothermales bacterium]